MEKKQVFFDPAYIETVGRILQNEKFNTIHDLREKAKAWFPVEKGEEIAYRENIILRLWTIYTKNNGLDANNPFQDMYYKMITGRMYGITTPV